MSFAIIFGVFFAGGIGAVIRLKLSRLNRGTGFPKGTFFANIIGCALFFFVALIFSKLSFFFGVNADFETANVILATGLCGAISTLSTAALEMNKIKKEDPYLKYMFMTMLIPIIFTILFYFFIK